MLQITLPSQAENDFDFSSPEGQKALEYALGLVMEIRDEVSTEKRKRVLYERTLGLAVIPMLLRRAAIVAVRWMKGTENKGAR